MSVRGKFKLSEVTQVYWSPTAKKLKFQAVCNDGTSENEKFHKYTPSGEISMLVDNESALQKFVIGASYYVDFTPAE